MLVQSIYAKKNITILTLVVLIFTFAAIAQITKLKLLTDYSVYFDEGNQSYNTFVSIENMFSKNDNVFLVVEAPESKDMFSEQAINLTYKLTEMAWKTPHSSRVESMTNFTRTQSFEDDIEIDDTVPSPDMYSQAFAEDVKAFVLNEPLLLKQLISEDGRLAAVNIVTNLPGLNQNKETADVMAYVDSMVTEIQTEFPGYTVYKSGLVVLNNTFFTVSKKDMTTLIPAMMLLVLIIASFLLRSFSSLFTLTIVVVFSTLAALGAAAALDISLTSPSLSAPIILLTISVASGVHIVSTIQKVTAESIHDSRQLQIVHAMKDVGVPVTLTCFTTIIGFLSMNLGDSPPFRDLGNIVSLGVAFTWLLSMTLIPCVLSFVQPKKVKTLLLSNSLARLANFNYKHSKAICLLAIPFVILISGLSFNNVPNDNFVEYFDETIPFRQDTQTIDEKLTGIHTFELSIESGKEYGVLTPESLVFADEFTQWLREQPEVANVYSITDVIKDINKSLHADDESFHKIPPTTEEVMQFILLYEMSLSFGKDLNDRLNIDKSAMRVTARFYNIDTQGVLGFEKKITDYLKHSKPKGLEVRNASLTTLFTHVGLITITSLVQGALLALVVVSIVLIFALRSLKIGMLSIIPNLIPIGLAFGIWALINGEISMGLASVTAMSIGIVVDDTIHFLHHYFNYRKQGLSAQQSCSNVLRNVGPALLVSSIVLSVGFFILTFSHFEKNALMGLLTGMTILIAFVCDLIILPAILMQWEKFKLPVKQVEAATVV